jgi:hypothetical protein
MVIWVLITLLIGPTLVDRFHRTTGGRIATQFGRLVYYIGLPYAALLAKSVAPIDLGLAGNSGPILGWSSVDWLKQLNDVLIVGAVVVIPIGLTARQMARAHAPLGVDERSTGAIMLDAAYAEVHWAFYRAAPFIILNDVYWATLMGLGLVGVEVLVAIVRNGLGTQPEERQSWIGQALFMAMSATLFILTHNLWLALGLHIVIELALKVWSTRLTGRADQHVTIEHETAAPPLETIEPPVA